MELSLSCDVEIELDVKIEPAVEIEPAVLIELWAGSISTSWLNFHISDIKKRDTFSVLLKK